MTAYERSSCAGPGLRPLHVMFLVHGFEIGGLENVVAHLINRCDQEQFRFSVCAMTQLGSARLRVRRADTRYYALNKPPGHNWSLILRIARILKDDPVDIVQTHEWGTYLEGLLSAWLARVPVRIHVEQGTPNWEYWRPRVVYRMTQRMVDRFVPVSEHLRRDMIAHLNVDLDKLQLISNAVETSQFVRTPTERERLRAALGVTRTDF